MVLGPARIVPLLFGVFLVFDALFLHLLTFNYSAVGAGWLDPYFTHLIWGVLLIVVALRMRAGEMVQ